MLCCVITRTPVTPAEAFHNMIEIRVTVVNLYRQVLCFTLSKYLTKLESLCKKISANIQLIAQQHIPHSSHSQTEFSSTPLMQ